MKDYVVLDLETTGLSKTRHRITEIAAVKVNKGKVVEEFQTLVNPKVSIPGFITRLTGITNDMVKDAPLIKEALPGFLSFVEDLPIIAHNATFDHGFIVQNAKKHLKKKFSNEKLCTKKLANRLLPELRSKRLSALCEHFKIKNKQAHRAMSDVKATHILFSNFLKMMKKKDIKGRENIINFERRPRS